jgi:hypothetical protein
VREEGEPAQHDPGAEEPPGHAKQRELGERRAHERQIDEVERRGDGRDHRAEA